MTIRVVTDSTSDLPQEFVKQQPITVVPLVITVGSKEMRDGVDISRTQFYAQLSQMHPFPKTAAPGPQVFRQQYERLAAEGADEILSIHISPTLSATLDSARQAAAETTSARVTAFDSRQLSLGTGYQVQAAAQAAAQGHTLPEIMDLLEAQIPRTHVFAALDTLEFMRRGGRMSGAIAALGTLLQVKPILKMYDGKPTAERSRTRQRALKRLRDLIAGQAPYERAAILHSGAQEHARDFRERIADLLPGSDVWMEEINPVIGAHLGPGVVGFAGVAVNH